MQIEQYYKEIPIVTRVYGTILILTSFAIYVDYLSPLNLYLNWKSIFHGELWRLITAFCLFDYAMSGISLAFHMIFFYKNSRDLEEKSFSRTSDFVFFYFYSISSILGLSYLLSYFPSIPQTELMFQGAQTLSSVLMYVWARRNPHVRVALFGVLPFSAPYLPYVIICLTLMMGSYYVTEIMGALVGHVYFFLEDVYPEVTGRRLLKTPKIFSLLFDPPVEHHLTKDEYDDQ